MHRHVILPLMQCDLCQGVEVCLNLSRIKPYHVPIVFLKGLWAKTIDGVKLMRTVNGMSCLKCAMTCAIKISTE